MKNTSSFFSNTACMAILIVSLFFGMGIPAALSNDAKTSTEDLSSEEKILLPMSEKRAQKQALGLQKERMGLQSWKELSKGIAISLAYTRAKPQKDFALIHKDRRITWGQLTDSLLLLEKLLPRLDKEPTLLAKNFTWLHLSPKTHFTSYFSPVKAASRTKKKGYTYPLYRVPDEIAPHLAHCLATHTCPETAFSQVIRPDPPYFSRAEIDLDGALQNRHLEIAWMPHIVDTYELMLQGSGLLAFDDGSTQAILFGGLNGWKGQSMLGYLMSSKELPRKKATMQGLRQWWDTASAKKKRAFLEASSGYAFFRYGAPKPQGTVGGALTPWVSMASDPRVLPLGGILAYSLPTLGKTKAGELKGNTKTLNGLGFAHDTGGAIQMRRIDLYAGEGQKGHDKAMSVYTKGDVWLLLKK